MNLRQLTADRLVSLYRNRDLSVSEVIQNTLGHIEEQDRETQAFLTVTRDRAIEEARRMDARIAAGEPLEPLAGVPIAIKDNLTTRDIPTTCGSKILSGYVPPYGATAVERLRAAGAIVIGKTNCDEFAMGSSTENSAYQVTRNPFDPTRVPGGSSGGSAAAVATGMSLLALGSDTGGSVRQPAAFCGIVGLKPSYGRVSRYGLVAFASSLDQVGTLTKTVRESALMLGIIGGHDPYDSTSSSAPIEDFTDALDKPIAGTRVGIPREYFEAGLDPEVKERVESGIRQLERLDCKIEDIRLPHTEYAIATYYLIATSEASSNLARYDGVRYGSRAKADTLGEMYRRTRMEGFGREVKLRILLGTFALSSGYYDAYYLKALKVRTLIARDFAEAFDKVDVIATPTSPTFPFRIGEKSNDPLSMYLSDIYTITCNLAGLPGIALPCGRNAEGLPASLQLIGNRFDEARLLRVAHQFERAHG